MQPADLIRNGLLGFQLYVFVDRGPNVVSFDRRHDFFNLFSHILRIDRNDLIAVFAAELALILQFKPVKSDKFIIFIAQTGIGIYLLHSRLNILINIQAA
ncbi:hypothetical protein D3C75_947940 [compost metagenome]